MLGNSGVLSAIINCRAQQVIMILKEPFVLLQNKSVISSPQHQCASTLLYY